MGGVKSLLENNLKDTYIHSIRLGKNDEDDKWKSFFANMNNEVQDICNQFKHNKNLTGGFNAIGFSQGGLFLRAYVEKCNDPPVKNLITIGSPHMGVSGIPNCLNEKDNTCNLMKKMAASGAYVPFVASHIVQAQYFKDPQRYDVYLKKNIFLPSLNNELEEKNLTLKHHLSGLQSLVLVKFSNDTMMVPKESAWFGFFDQHGQLSDLRDLNIYLEDWIGLRKLDENSKLFFEAFPGNHLELSDSELLRLVEIYFKPPTQNWNDAKTEHSFSSKPRLFLQS